MKFINNKVYSYIVVRWLSNSLRERGIMIGDGRMCRIACDVGNIRRKILLTKCIKAMLVHFNKPDTW